MPRRRGHCQPISARLRFVRDLRHLVAVNAAELASATAAVSERPLAEKLASERCH